MDTSPEVLDERNQEHNECYQSLPHAMAFTVHFDSDKQSGTTDGYNFTRRHVRNLSLPIPKVYENKVNTESPSNGKTLRKAGNHSEGYFSSDPDEEQGKPKLFVAKVRNIDKKISKPTNLAQEKKIMSCSFNIDRDGRDRGDINFEQEREDEEEEEERVGSDVASEAGTYTIDKDSPEVTTARLNIDNEFGINCGKNSESQIKFQMSTTHGNSTWINEWATQVVEHNHQSNSVVNTRNHSITTTKIPSPVNSRARLPPVTQPMKGEHPNIPLRPLSSRKSNLLLQDECSDSSLETECFLKATERLVSAMAARVSLALDSGGESDVETNSCSHIVEAAPATDSSASDSGQKPTQMRYNRAFSLRRGRLDEPKKKDTPATTLVSKTRTYSDAPPPKPVPTRVVKRDPPPTPSPSFSRTDCGRFSMRTRPTPTTPVLSGAKKDTVGKKKIATGGGSSGGGGGGGRSNSTLSSREVEFQNWKRRKSYDPMKAAAEGKKKEAAKKQSASPVMTQSTNSTITTPKSPVNPVLRSASFHGTRQLTVSSSDDEEEVVLSGDEEEEEWPVLQVPRTSLENTPQGSRISLYSNSSNPSSLRARPKLEAKKVTVKGEPDKEKGVDSLVISALSGLSSKLKGSSCNLLKKLRYLYDEDSPKCHQLNAEIEQLEASEPGSPQVKSPSRELSTTLRNLKRLESMLRVLDDVLFDEEEFQ